MVRRLRGDRPYFGSSPGSSPVLVDWPIRMIVDTPVRVLLETLKLNTDVHMIEELRKIAVPARVKHKRRPTLAAVIAAAVIAGDAGGLCGYAIGCRWD
jgi:hypothetical protein